MFTYLLTNEEIAVVDAFWYQAVLIVKAQMCLCVKWYFSGAWDATSDLCGCQ